MSSEKPNCNAESREGDRLLFAELKVAEFISINRSGERVEKFRLTVATTNGDVVLRGMFSARDLFDRGRIGGCVLHETGHVIANLHSRLKWHITLAMAAEAGRKITAAKAEQPTQNSNRDQSVAFTQGGQA